MREILKMHFTILPKITNFREVSNFFLFLLIYFKKLVEIFSVFDKDSIKDKNVYLINDLNS